MSSCMSTRVYSASLTHVYSRVLCHVSYLPVCCFLASRDGGLPKLSQIPELTYYRAGGGDVMKDLFLWPYGGQNRNAPFATGRKTGQLVHTKVPIIVVEFVFTANYMP